jgi:hypothetical protein
MTQLVPIILILLFLLFLILFYCNTEHFGMLKYEYFEITNFKAPPSFTDIGTFKSSNENNNGNRTLKVEKKDIKDIIDKLNSISHHDKRGFHTKHLSDHTNITDNHVHLEQGNLLTFPNYFNAWDKWPGCLPDALYQGSCGSCWAFATVTALSSRFYIETCGDTGCRNYPQLNQQALDHTMDNIEGIYKFNKITITKIVDKIDTNKDGVISEKEWVNIAKTSYEKALSENINESSEAMNILIYILNFHSFGSIRFTSEKPQLYKIIDRAKRTFSDWKDIDNVIVLKKWKEQWFSKPLPLSAEKLIACCYPECYKEMYKSDKTNNPSCSGGSLINAWKIVRDTGTPTSVCTGYNLDDWEEGDDTRGCKETLGPNYSYCSSYSTNNKINSAELMDIITQAEKDGVEPVTINRNVPWINPQIFRFRAKNAYQVKSSMTNIQREIMERGPVTTGYQIYSDFQYEFGTKGMGGQGYKVKGNQDNLVGGSKDSLIYMHIEDGTEPMSGHAITITGWGEYGGIPYWICLNSWGSEWGTSGYTDYNNRSGIPKNMKSGGYFWFVRGINNCEFEDNVVAGQPNLENISYPGTVNNYGWGLPYPDLKDVTLIDKLKTDDSVDKNLRSSDVVEGGGTYIASSKSSSKPSPYIFFWPDERPRYVVGKLLKPVNKNINDITINVSKETANNFLKLIKIQKKPIFIIDDEQLQFNEIIRTENFGNVKNVKNIKNIKYSSTQNEQVIISVFRAVGNTIVDYHKEDSTIIIFPWKELHIGDLEFLESVV